VDEVVTCKCGCQAWVIGTSGTRCSKCGFWLGSLLDVRWINAMIQTRVAIESIDVLNNEECQPE